MTGKNSFIIKHIDNQKAECTSHGVGEKRVLITGSQCQSNLMQAASGQMKSGEEVISHRHQTMEEFYFFNKGVAKLIIDNVNYDCIAGTFVKIPANAVHSLIATEDIDFTYWGIAL